MKQYQSCDSFPGWNPKIEVISVHANCDVDVIGAVTSSSRKLPTHKHVIYMSDTRKRGIVGR